MASAMFNGIADAGGPGHLTASGQAVLRRTSVRTIMGSDAFQRGMLDVSLGIGFSRTRSDATKGAWRYERGRLFAVATGMDCLPLQGRGKNRQIAESAVALYVQLRKDGTIL